MVVIHKLQIGHNELVDIASAVLIGRQCERSDHPVFGAAELEGHVGGFERLGLVEPIDLHKSIDALPVPAAKATGSRSKPQPLCILEPEVDQRGDLWTG